MGRLSTNTEARRLLRQEKARRASENSMDRPSIAARVLQLARQAAKRSSGATVAVIFAVLHDALDSNTDARDISSALKERYDIDLSQEEVAEYARFRASEPSNSPRGTDGAARRAESTRARIIAALLTKVDGIVEEIIRDPSSETTKLVKCLLLTQMTTEDARIEDVEALFKEERRREQLAKELEIKKAELKQKDRSLAMAMKKMNGVKGITDKARKAVEGHKPFDYDRALKQISAVIGVGRPLVRRVEPQAQV